MPQNAVLLLIYSTSTHNQLYVVRGKFSRYNISERIHMKRLKSTNLIPQKREIEGFSTSENIKPNTNKTTEANYTLRNTATKLGYTTHEPEYE